MSTIKEVQRMKWIVGHIEKLSWYSVRFIRSWLNDHYDEDGRVVQRTQRP